MASSRLRKSLANLKRRRKTGPPRTKFEKRRPRLEPLEDRRLMALGPTLVSVVPNDEPQLSGGPSPTLTFPSTFPTSPHDISFRFAQGTAIDPASLKDGIQVVRAGADHQFGTADDRIVTPGFVGLGDTPREVIMRFAATLPDDAYHITLIGVQPTGSTLLPLRDTSGNPFSVNGVAGNQTISFTLDVGAKIDAIVPQPIGRNGTSLVQSNNTVDVYFDQQMSTVDVTKPTFYHLIDTATGAITLPSSIAYTEDATLSIISAGTTTLSWTNPSTGTVATATSPLNIVNQTSRVTITNAGTGNAGTFTLTVNGSTTAPIAAFGATAATVQSALNALSGLNGNVSVVAGPGGAGVVEQFDITFQGTLSGRSVTVSLTPSGTGTAGTVVQTIAASNLPATGGVGASGSILNNLNTIPGLAGKVNVTGSPGGPYTIQFTGSLAGTNVPAIASSTPIVTITQQPKATLTFASAIAAGTYKLEIGTTSEQGSDRITVAQRLLNSMATPIQAYIGDNLLLSGAAQNNDFDLYRFEVQSDVTDFTVNVAPLAGSTLNTFVRIFKADGTERQTINNGAAGAADTATISLPKGTYYVGVSSSGNAGYNANTGSGAAGGTATGSYSIQVTFSDLPANIQTLTLLGDGTTTFSFNGVSGTIPLDVVTGNLGTTAAEVQLALDSVPDLTGNLTVTGQTGGPFTVTMTGALAGQSVPLIVSSVGNVAITATDDRYLGLNNSANKDNSSFDTASDTGFLGNAGRSLSGAILPSPDPYKSYNINFPGSGDAPGDRNIPYLFESYLQTPVGQAPDPTPGVETITYDFQSFYGYTAQGNVLLNAITDIQKQRTREIFELLSQKTGMQFHEVDPLEDGSVLADISVVTGDIRAIDPQSTTQFLGNGTGFTRVSASPLQLGNPENFKLDHQFAIMNANFDWGNSEFGSSWMINAIQAITVATGIQQHRELPDISPQNPNSNVEHVFPTDADVVLDQALHRPESNDIDLYKFAVTEPGLFRAETIAERLATSTVSTTDGKVPDAPNLLNTVLTLYRETTNTAGVKTRTVVARNDDYYGNDSALELHLDAGTYYVAVTSVGNTEFDPTVLDSGFGGLTQGTYQLSMSVKPDANIEPGRSADPGLTRMHDAGTSFLDGDGDGKPGGTYQFWFQANTSSNTIYVDKSSTANQSPSQNPNLGTIGSPYNTLSAALSAASSSSTKKIVRIVGNGGTDGNVSSFADDKPYLLGFKDPQRLQPLADGGEFQVPKDVTVMIDAGAVFKLRRTNLNAGTTPQGLLSKSGGAIQVLGTPNTQVVFTSYSDDSLGGDSNPTEGPGVKPQGGDYGGIVFRDDSDHEDAGVYLNYVNHALMSYGGGKVTVDSVEDVYDPIYMATARPTVSYNTIQRSANAAMSANPNSFYDDGLPDANGELVAMDQRRIGPDIHDNVVGSMVDTTLNNSVNGLFVRVKTQAGSPLDFVDLTTRWKSTDIVYVVSENLLVSGTPGGSIFPGTQSSTGGQAPLTSTLEDGRLRIDPGVVVKLSGTRIETKISSQFIAEGTVEHPIIFTSIKDDRYGAGGTYDTNKDVSLTNGAPGQWGGLYFGPSSVGSIDHAAILYAGGVVPVEGGFDSFNAVDVEQANVRLTNTLLQFNAGGGAAPFDNRNGRGTNTDAVVFVRGAQPIIVGNIFRDNSISATGIGNGTGAAISVNANALTSTVQGDYGRSTGESDRFTQFDDNHGPLVRSNRLTNNTLNGMEVRGETLTTETVWDDTDIAHILRSDVQILNQHVYGGLRLQSSPTQSLVVKLRGANAGFTADGVPLDISDRIGGTLQVIGQPGHPVVLTSLADDTESAGFDPAGLPVFDTNNDAAATTPQPGDWRSLSLNKLSNDTNVSEVLESEPAYVGVDGALDNNRTPQRAQPLGALAPNDKSGDDYRRLGFQVDGTIAMDNPSDVDLYSFTADSGTEVWFDIDRTSAGLDAMIELVDADGNPIATATNTDTNNAVVTPVTPYVTVVRQGTATLNEIQKVQLLAPPGTAPYTFTLSFNGQTTGPISSGATANNVLAALLAIPGTPPPFLPGDLSVTGAAGGPWQVTFQGGYQHLDVPLLGTPLPGLSGLAQSFDKDHFSGRDTYSTNPGLNVQGPNIPITDLAPGVPIIITSPNHGLESGDRVIINNVEGTTEANGTYTVTVTDPNHFSLDSSVGSNLYVAGTGTWAKLIQTSRDPIMRVVLPNAANGTPLKDSPWFIRVRSQPLVFTGEAGNTVNPGLTRGQYQLQVRIQQADHKPGSVVRFSDIRYATNGIEVHGLPAHTPLAGETAESDNTANVDQAGAQFLGNLLTVDKNTISVGGQIANINDVDWYRFDMNTDLTQFYGSGFNTFATMFDIDYADGIARPDTSIAVFDQDGRLIYVGGNGDQSADQPAPGQGLDADDLSRGSFGQQDAYLGSVQMPAGKIGSRTRTYYVAVSTDRQIPTTLNQQFQSNANDQLVRLEPIDSLGRIVSDHINQAGGETATLPQNQYIPDPTTGLAKSSFLDITDKQSLSTNVVPFSLSDVSLFFSEAGPGGANRTDLGLVDPATGIVDIRRVGTIDSGNLAADDITMRGDGTLWAYESDFTAGNTTHAGNVLQLDPASATPTALGPDNIPFPQGAPPVPPTIQSVNSIPWNGVGALAWGGNPINPPANRTLEPLMLAVNDFSAGVSALYFANFANGNGNFVQNQPWGRVFGNSLTNPLYLTNSTRATTSTNFNIPGLLVTFQDISLGNSGNGRHINFSEDTTAVPGAPPVVGPDQTSPNDVSVVFNPNSSPASITKTFGPNNIANLTLTAVTPGSAGNAINFTFNQQNLGTNAKILISVTGNNVTMTLNTLPGQRPTVQELIDAINTDSRTSQMVIASTNGDTTISALDIIPQSPFQLNSGRDATTVQQLVDAINAQPGLNLNATFAPSSLGGRIIGDELQKPNPVTQLTLSGGSGATGFTTGLAFAPDANTLYGVSDQGQFFQVDIDPRGGTFSAAQNAKDLAGNPALIFPPVQVTIPDLIGAPDNSPGGFAGTPSFTGLARGPLNLNNAEFANTFFATTIDGKLVCLDNNGNPLQVFDRNGDGVRDSYSVQLRTVNNNGSTSAIDGSPTGLAFSPLDFNLWHPTDTRGGDAGHNVPTGTTAVPDLSDNRFNSNNNTSFYFGFENTGQGAALGPYGQLPATGQSTTTTVNGAVSNFNVTATVVDADFAGSVIDPDPANPGTITPSTIPFDGNDPNLNNQANVGRILTFTSGNNITVQRPIQSIALNATTQTFVFTLATPLPQAPADGDTFSIQVASPTVFTGDGSLQNVDVYSGKFLRFTSGPNIVSPPIQIQAYNPATREFTMASAFVAAPRTGDAFVIQNLAPATRTRFDGGANLSNKDSFYTGGTLQFTSGALVGESQVITNYIGASHTFIFAAPGFSAIPADQDTFTITLSNPVKPEFLPDGGQYGILSRRTVYTGSTGLPGAPRLNANRTAAELLNNPLLPDSYNFPGGAYGSLETGKFSLLGVQASDLPTFYFDYFLDTEDANSTFQARNMVDSARVFIGRPGPGGMTWELLATNNDHLDSSTNAIVDGELPTFLSRQAGDFPSNPRQQVQELWDNSGNWRQARVDLSRYAGLENLQVRIDFSSAGTMNRSNTFEDSYYPGNPGSLGKVGRLQDNAHQGFFVDNFTVGLAGRGEMVVNSQADATVTAAPQRQNLFPGFPPPAEIQDGAYQLEIRRGTDFATSLSPTVDRIALTRTFDINQVLQPDLRVTTPISPIITEGFESGTFTSNPLLKWETVGQAPWVVSNQSANTGNFSAASSPIGNNQQSMMQVTLVTGAGDVSFARSTQSDPSDFLRFYIDGVLATDVNGLAGEWSDNQPFQTFRFHVSAGRHTFRWSYEKNDTNASASDKVFVDDISFPTPFVGADDLYADPLVYQFRDATNAAYGTPDFSVGPLQRYISSVYESLHIADVSLPSGMQRVGDPNLHRVQGHIQIEQNAIDSALNAGILVDAGPREAGSNNPFAAVRNLPTLSTDGLVPGITVSNNVVSNSGQVGISFAGDANAQVNGQPVPTAAVPFGRIINNTIYGGGTAAGTGINVGVNAGPSLLNNIVANAATGIVVDPTSTNKTVIGANLFSGNTADGPTGTNAILLAAGAPLFTNAATLNFYPVDNSPTIDSSLNTLADRPSISAVKSAVGIPQSPILAPDRDLFGQLRLDDPTQNPPPGLGQNIFKDRGAVERADFSQPTAFVSDPLDNDSNHRDRNSLDNDVAIRNESLTEFKIKLVDVGVGIDNATAQLSANYTLFATPITGGPPVQLYDVGTQPTGANPDYQFVYNPATNEAIFVPISGIWPLNFTYTIKLNNTPAGTVDSQNNPIPPGILDLAGNPILSNRTSGETSFNIFVGTLYDFGDAPDPKYPTLLASNGAAHAVQDGFHLGAAVTEESEAFQSPNADGDTGDDGITFGIISPTLNSQVTVTAAIPDGTTAFLDAWFDLNRDGDWNDPLEHVIDHRAVDNGTHTLDFTFGDAATLKGDTFARFRLSSAGTSSPTGTAPDGEVEDYKITVFGPPYQNPNNRLDVNASGAVSPADALTVINYLNTYGSIALPTNLFSPAGGGPGNALYVDTTGDNFMSPQDALDVIDFLNSRSIVGGEGEAAAALAANSSSDMIIPPVLLASPDVVLEVRQPAPVAALLATQAASTTNDQSQDLALLALGANGAQADGLAPVSSGGSKSENGQLEEPGWDELLTSLASDQKRK